MKKRIVIPIILILLLSILAACGKQDVKIVVSDTISKASINCAGSVAGHRYTRATCEEPPTCTLCGDTIGVTLGHKAYCDRPDYCRICKNTVDKAIIRHDWNDPTCLVPYTCDDCGYTQGKADEHRWSFYVSESDGLITKCWICGEEKESYSATDDGKESSSYLGGTGYLSLDAIAGDVVQVAVHAKQVAVLRSDGTVRVIGDNSFGQCDTTLWRNVVKIWADNYVTFGLTKDGRVLATSGDYSDWTDVTDLIIHRGYHMDEATLCPAVVAIKTDGTVMATGYIYEEIALDGYRYDFSDWTDIQDVVIDSALELVIGLKNDGSIVIAGNPDYNDSTMQNIKTLVHDCQDGEDTLLIAKDGKVYNINRDCTFRDIGLENIDSITIACFEGYIAGITKSGKVISSNYYDHDAYKETLPGFYDIIELVSCRSLITGLRKDGTVVYTKYNYEGPVEAVAGTDILKIVEFVDGLPVGLRNDGTIWYSNAEGGWSFDSFDTAIWNSWEDVVDIWSSGWANLVALTKDGKILCHYADRYPPNKADFAILTADVKH